MDLWRIGHLAAVFCLTCLLLKALQLYRRRQELLATLSSFPGAPMHWLHGHIYEMLPISSAFKKVEIWSRLYPFAFPLWIGCFSASLVITHPDYAKTLLARTDPKDNVGYRHLVPWIGKGLLVLDGPKWVQHRKLLTPGFHYTILKPYVTLMAESTKVMLDKWEQLVTQGKSVELFEHVSLMTLDSIMKCAFSHSSNCQMDRKNSYVQAVFDLCSLVFSRTYNILGQSDLTYWFTPQGFQFRKACQVAHLHTDEIIKGRKESLKDEAELQKILKKRHLDFLDILLCAKDDKGNPLSDEDLQAEVDTFMFGGHDTTASGISWLLYCMAQNPEHQQKCREEIKAIMGDRDTIQWNDLSEMTYCTMCIKESLRLYSPVSGVSRQLNKPITFFDGRSLPEGAWVVLSIHLIHKNPAIWNDPEVFDPLRFSPDNTASRNSHAFLPFSAGPRNCIGQQFAMNELKVALAMTLLRFQLSPDPTNPPPIPIPQIVLRSENGIHLRLEKVV
ncbi:cytochrome P450 4B1-like [Tiliqua scincoides]|uniref:cytochrome P450 4B1-like n=1 Tax=Tiliqua scincoides TaxID=71010 RepID=UPI0034634F97